MRIMWTVSILAAVFTAPLDAQRSARLDGKSRSALTKLMQAYVKASEDEKKEMLPRLMVWGRPGIEFIGSLARRRGFQSDVVIVRHRAKKWLGWDLLEAGEPKGKYRYAPNYFGFEEIVTFRKGDLFGGIQVRDDDVMNGRVTVRWWAQRGRVKKLDQPGGSKGELSVTGEPSARPIKANAGYTEYDFDFEVADLPFRIRYVGPAFFLIEYRSGVAYAFPGKSSPRNIRNTDENLGFSSSYPRPFARIRELLPQYVFRVVPGCDPLPLEEGERDSFAQYEAVQVDVRATRPKGDAIVLVRFLEPELITLEALHVALLRNFIREIAPVPDRRILILGGNNAALEGNRFWKGTAFERPWPALREFLRKNFPEDY